MTYTVVYDPLTGKPVNVRTDGGTLIPFDDGNGDFQVFKHWNSRQPSPLDYTTPKRPAVGNQP